MTSHQSPRSIAKPVAALVRRSDGEERVKIRPPILPIDDHVWNDAFDEAAGSLASAIISSGGHGQQF